MKERRKVLAVIGNAGAIGEDLARTARELGCGAIDAGFRLVTGGLNGVMAAASEGAHQSSRYVEGLVVGVLPSYDSATANPWVDVVITTGLQLSRNVLVVSMADVVIAIGGGAGTLSEIALAWQLGRPIVALWGPDGWSTELAGEALDQRHADPIHRAESVQAAIELAIALTGRERREAGEIGSGWRGTR